MQPATPIPAPRRSIDFAAFAPLVLGLVIAIDYFDSALFSFFSSYIAGGVSATADELIWASSAYALCAVLGILQEHAWVERVGYRRYIATCMFAFGIGGICAALAETPIQLMLARGFQGYFVGPMLGACRILIQVGIPPRRQPSALSSFAVSVTFAGALASIIGAFLVTHFEWRSLFVVSVPFAALAGFAALRTLPDVGDLEPHERTEPHYVACIVFALTQAALQVVVTRTRFELFSGSPTLIGLTIASVAGIAWFAWHQWRHPAPLMRLSVLRESSFQAGLALYIVFYYLSTGMSLLLPRLMEGGLGFTVGDTGYFTGSMSLLGALTIFLHLKYARRVKRQRWLVVSGFAFATLSAWWFTQITPQVDRLHLVVPLVLYGTIPLFVMLPVGGMTFRAFNDDAFAHSYRLKNLVRQLAISFATATFIALQQHRIALHETRLSEATTPSNPGFVQALDALTRGFVATGHAAAEAHTMALASLARVMEQQATFMASLDGFEVLAVIAVLAGIYAAWHRRIG